MEVKTTLKPKTKAGPIGGGFAAADLPISKRFFYRFELYLEIIYVHGSHNAPPFRQGLRSMCKQYIR